MNQPDDWHKTIANKVEELVQHYPKERQQDVRESLQSAASLWGGSVGGTNWDSISSTGAAMVDEGLSNIPSFLQKKFKDEDVQHDIDTVRETVSANKPMIQKGLETGAGIVGGVATSLIPGMAPLNATKKLKGGLGVATRIGEQAAKGAVQGGVSGLTKSKTGEELDSAISSAKTGAIFGGAGGTIAEGANALSKGDSLARQLIPLTKNEKAELALSVNGKVRGDTRGKLDAFKKFLSERLTPGASSDDTIKPIQELSDIELPSNVVQINSQDIPSEVGASFKTTVANRNPANNTSLSKKGLISDLDKSIDQHNELLNKGLEALDKAHPSTAIEMSFPHVDKLLTDTVLDSDKKVIQDVLAELQPQLAQAGLANKNKIKQRIYKEVQKIYDKAPGSVSAQKPETLAAIAADIKDHVASEASRIQSTTKSGLLPIETSTNLGADISEINKKLGEYVWMRDKLAGATSDTPLEQLSSIDLGKPVNWIAKNTFGTHLVNQAIRAAGKVAPNTSIGLAGKTGNAILAKEPSKMRNVIRQIDDALPRGDISNKAIARAKAYLDKNPEASEEDVFNNAVNFKQAL